MKDEQAFIDTINQAPLDHGLRLMYSDWLDEHDRPEEADRQRGHVEAYHVIKEYTREWYNQDYDEEYNPIPGTDKFDYTKVIEEVHEWESSIRNRGKKVKSSWSGYEYDIDLCFGTNHAQDKLGESAENRAAFWKAFTILTGLEPPADLKEQEWYSCAC